MSVGILTRPQYSIAACSVLLSDFDASSLCGIGRPSRPGLLEPANDRNVGARSVWLVTISSVLPSGTPGPLTRRGTFTSVSGNVSMLF